MVSKTKSSGSGVGLSAKVVIRPGQAVTTINPNIYGHFAEHLGRCIYDGIWVGPDSKVPNVDGYRREVLEALKRLKAPVIRWPGGCFADAYHWKDGIGPVAQRPKGWNLWWDNEESNTFGTDEFLRFCERVGAAPYICVNVGSGTPAEALEWIEYCNSRRDTSVARLRAKNGHPAPYNVRYWGIGNENWGCGGCFDPESYATEYKRFATYLKRASVRIGGQMIACGHAVQDWNARFFDKLGQWARLVDHISFHHYFKAGNDIDFSDEEYYTLLADVSRLEEEIIHESEVIKDFTQGEREIGLIIDEWGTWHPQAITSNGLEQQNTQRDAVFTGAVLNLFNRHASSITMTNIAQTINVLQCVALTTEADTVLTPTYHVFDLFKDHMGGDLVVTEVDTPTVSAKRSGKNWDDDLAVIDVSASLKSNSLFVTLVNKALGSDVEVEFALRGSAKFSAAALGQIASADVRDHNNFDEPRKIKPTAEKLRAKAKTFRHIVPAHSVNAFKFELT